MTDGKQPTINVRASFQKAYDKSQIKKESYIENLKAAKGDDIFKYLLLIDAEQLEGYVNQTRIQADKSFTLSRNGAIAGFMLLCGGIVLGWIFNILGRNGLEVAYLTSLAGILTEFISGVFFYLYNKTLEQLNLFHDTMYSSKQIITSILTNNLVEDKDKKDESKIELAKILMSNSSK